MFMVLTNAAENFEDQPIAIRKDAIITVFQSTGKGDEQRTYVFGPPHGTWEVKESLETVVQLLSEE